VFYLVGIVISAGIFIHQFIKLKGITIKKIKEEIRERRTAKDIEETD
jgi:Na+/melibiose symporter-like transporter